MTFVEMGCEHSPYSPDLAPSDYHLFPYLKQFFASNKRQCFASNVALKKVRTG